MFDSQYNKFFELDNHYSEVAVCWTDSKANVIGWTVIIAMLLWPGQSYKQLLCLESHFSVVAVG